MPSGSKKRKAAKKKMAEEANNANSAPPYLYGDDDPKHHDEKDSDGGDVSSPASGDVSSPASQDHHSHQHPFTEGEEEEVEKREDSSSVQSFVTENKSEEVNNGGESTHEVVLEEEGVIQIDEEFKPVDDSKDKIVIIESPKESHGGSSESSNSGSSDDESHVHEKNTIVVETAPPFDSIKLVDSLSEEVKTQISNGNPTLEINHLVEENYDIVDSEKVSLLEQVVHVNGSASVDNSVTSNVVVDSSLTENGEKKLLLLDKNTRVSPAVMDLGSQKNEDEVVLTSDQYATASSGSQPLVASAPRTVQTTSWKNCCGMFELFTGSNR